MSKNVNVIISEDDLEKFRECWAEFDNNVRLHFNHFSRGLASSRSKIYRFSY